MKLDYDLDAVLADIRAGKPYAEVASRHGMSRPLVSRIAIQHGLRRRRQYVMTNPVATKRQDDWRDYPDPTDDDALRDGQWVLDRRARILRWAAA